MGLGAAMVFPSTLSLLSNVFTERNERARAIGLWGATAGMAIALGPIIGGWLLAHLSWTSIFFAMAPVAAVAALLVALFVPTSRDPSTAPLDGPAFVLSTAAMSLIVFTIIEAPNARLGERCARIAGFVGAVSCSLRSSRGSAAHEQPMLDVALFRNPRFTAACAAVTVAFFTLFGFIFLITQYFQFIKGYSAAFGRRTPAPGRVRRSRRSSCWARSLAVRFGTKVVVTAGLADGRHLLPVGRDRQRRRTGYAIIAAQMVLYGTRHGAHQCPGDRGHHGRRPARQGRRRLCRQRRHAAARRDARRRRDRQRVRVGVRESRRCAASAARCRPTWLRWRISRSARR